MTTRSRLLLLSVGGLLLGTTSRESLPLATSTVAAAFVVAAVFVAAVVG